VSAHLLSNQDFNSLHFQPVEDQTGSEYVSKKLPRDIVAKITDFENACWTFKHFTDEIATRQYRPPEVIVGCDYDTSVDVWSLACMVFELLTGDYLFDPKEDPHKKFSRDEDHLAMMIELLGKMPRRLWRDGARSKEYFSRNGDLKHIKNLEFWALSNVLTEKYNMTAEDGNLLGSFLLPMLDYDPKKRATASQCLQHPWLREVIQKPTATGDLEFKLEMVTDSNTSAGQNFQDRPDSAVNAESGVFKPDANNSNANSQTNTPKANQNLVLNQAFVEHLNLSTDHLDNLRHRSFSH